MQSYNPFNKSLDTIEIEDLVNLKNVSEGWFVEYKRQIPNTKSIAKSITAFANHYGGFLFYGISEREDGTNQAEKFPGINISEIEGSLEKIRNSAIRLINPTPHFEIKVLKGPCAELDIDESKSIIMVYVPIGNNAPYIHSSGRIYLRQGDSSEPKETNDRFILDGLWQRTQNIKDKIKHRITNLPLVSKAEGESAFLHLHLIPDIYESKQLRSILNFKEYSDLMNSKSENGADIIFDNNFTMSNGFISRHIFNNEASKKTLTFKYFNDCSAMITIPLQEKNAIDLSDKYNNKKELCELLEKNGLHKKIIDCNQLLLVFWSILSKYLRLLKKEKYFGEISVKAIGENLWRKIPFLDSDLYLNFIKQHNFPLIQDDEILIPYGLDLEDFIKIDYVEPDPKDFEEFKPILVETAKIFNQIIDNLGIPSCYFAETDITRHFTTK